MTKRQEIHRRNQGIRHQLAWSGLTFALVALSGCNKDNQTSVLRFIEDSWVDRRRIPRSYDAITGLIMAMLAFTKSEARLNAPLFLDEGNGKIAQ